MNILSNLGRSILWFPLSLCISLQAQVAYGIGRLLFWLKGRQDQKKIIDLAKVKHVLVVRIDEIGDLIMTTPFLRELRALIPKARITLMVQPGTRALVELCPYVNDVWIFDQNVPRFLRPLRLPWRAFWIGLQRCWPHRFDLAIVPRWDTDSYYATFLAYFSGASYRVGYSENVNARKQRLNKGFDRLYTHVLDDRALRHDVERNLKIVRSLGGTIQDDRLELWVGEDDDAFAENVFKECGLRSENLIIGFGPSGGHSLLKQWPVRNFVELGKRLQRKYNAHILVIGGPGEETLGHYLGTELGSSGTDMIGKTTLRQMVALLKQCHLYIGNDSGPMHAAAAMGVPVVALFGSSCHHRFGPWGNKHTIVGLELPCNPCSQGHLRDRCQHCIFDQPHCMVNMTVEQVQRVAEKIIHKQVSL